jgi:GT2 family glycosyltransferase
MNHKIKMCTKSFAETHSTPDVSIVMLNFNREQYLVESLKSLYDGGDYQKIIVVDNDSKDASVERVKKEFPQVTMLETGKNIGYAAGMNRGIFLALKDLPRYVLIMNCDTIIEKKFVQQLAMALDTDQMAVASSGTILYYPETSKIWYAGGRIIPWRASGFTRTKTSKLKTPHYVTFLSGCAFMVRASAIRQYGAFDERFFMYAEDTELCARLQSKGQKLVYVPEAIVYHRVDKEQIKPVPLYFNTRNRFLFLELCTSGIQRFVGTIYLFSVVAIKMLCWSFSRPRLVIAMKVAIADYLNDCYGEGHCFSLQEMVD